MKRMLHCGLAAALIATCAIGAMAQGGPGGFGGGQMPPEMAKKIEKWRKWRDNHKNFEAIQQSILGLGECMKDAKTDLTKDQAKAVLDTLNKYKGKPFLTNDEAGAANKAMTARLNVAQIKKIATTENPFRRGGGGRPGGGMGAGRPGGGGPGGARPGGGGPGGGPGGFVFPDPKDYNPLNADTLPFERMPPMAKQRMAEFTGSLQKRAK